MPAILARAKFDIELARDMAANILNLMNATESGTAVANALSRRIYWLNWLLVFVGVAGIGTALWIWGASTLDGRRVQSAERSDAAPRGGHKRHLTAVCVSYSD